MIEHDSLPRLAALLGKAAALTLDVAEDGVLDRVTRLVDRAPADDVEGLLEIVGTEVETYRLRREGSLLISGSRMRLNPTARIYARASTRDEPDSALSDTARRVTHFGIRLLSERLGMQADPLAPAATDACRDEPRHRLERALTLARTLLQRIEPGTPDLPSDSALERTERPF